jgi:hypothetical protein
VVASRHQAGRLPRVAAPRPALAGAALLAGGALLHRTSGDLSGVAGLLSVGLQVVAALSGVGLLAGSMAATGTGRHRRRADQHDR